MQLKLYAQDYLAPTHLAVLEMITPQTNVLEMGCATGYFTRALKSTKGCRVTCVEINEIMAETARPHADALIVGDIEDPATWRDLQGPFDYVLYLDVLEHLVDPWEALRRTHKLLSPKGCVIASIPNVAQYRIRLKLLLGIFDYKPCGILDDSHLRFFTEKTARQLFANTGYIIIEQQPINRRTMERTFMKLAPRVFAIQFLIRARPFDQLPI